jgi:hypothetical protein
MIITTTRKFLLAVLFFISTATFGQNIRGFYITNIGSWLGNTTKETAILNYAQGNGYNYIAFYDLGDINWSNSSQKNLLASFMRRAKEQYGITQTGAVVETYSYAASNVVPYNNSRSNANEKFDVLNLEFEFWNLSSIRASYCSKFLSPAGCSCDTAGAWKFAWKQFKQIDSTAAANGMISEVYLGWPNKGQMQQLASRADRILLHAYRPTDADIYSYSRNRLIDLASLGSSKKVIALFSGESSFMGPWLASHPITRPYQTYSSNLSAETASFKQYVNLQGYHWFTYDDMPKTMAATATITASGPITFCPGGSVTLTANSGSSYLWSPNGETTRSINISAAGSYAVRVTNSSGISVMSSTLNVSHTTVGPIPSITASGPVAFCPGGNVALTSTSAGSYLWSNGETTQTITVAASGNYKVTTYNGGCSGTSSTTIVDANATPVSPTITSDGLTVCAGGTITLKSSSAGNYLWSNGATTRSITVSTPGTYFVMTTTGSCSATSTNTTITNGTSPATPTITASGATSFCPGGNVTLTASTASNYLWSNGATTSSITVTTSGDYTVTAGGAGCGSTSSTVSVNAASTPPPPIITSSSSLSICPGSQITLTSSPAGGYLWSNGQTTQSISVSTAGNYSVRAYAGPNCSSQSSIKTVTLLSAPATPVITASGPTLLSTTNTSVDLTSSSASNYLWSNGISTQTITVTNPANYKVTVTGANGCVSTSAPTVVTSTSCTPPPTPTISLNGSGTLTPGQTVTLTSSAGGGYRWSTGETTQSIIVSQAGVYTVNVYNGGNCYSTSVPTIILMIIPKDPGGKTPYDILQQRISAGLSSRQPIAFSIYPNPAKESFNLSFTLVQSSELTMKMFDVSGREVMYREIKGVDGDNLVSIDATTLKQGIYFATITGNDWGQIVKVVVE